MIGGNSSSFSKKEGYQMVKVGYCGAWIRDHLSEVKEDFIQNMSTQYRREMKETKNHVSSYHSFCKMVYVLESLGLIEFTREELASRDWLKPRKYYQIKPGMENSIKWKNPQKHYETKAT